MEKYDKAVEVIIAFLDLLISYLPLFIFFGLIYILVLEWKTVLKMVKEKNKLSDPKYFYKVSIPILKRCCYLLGGILLSIGGFIIVASMQRFIVQELPGEFPYTEKGNYVLAVSGVAAVLTFHFAGIALILSAGGRFLVNTAKFITLLTIGSILVLLVLAHAQLI